MCSHESNRDDMGPQENTHRFTKKKAMTEAARISQAVYPSQPVRRL